MFKVIYSNVNLFIAVIVPSLFLPLSTGAFKGSEIYSSQSILKMVITDIRR